MKLPEKKLLVLGIGNDIMGDDAVGLRAARMLQEELPTANIQESYSLGLDLLDLLEGYSCVLLLDSVVTHAYVPGTIMEFDQDQIRLQGRVSPHHAGIAETLEMARILQVPLPEHLSILAMEVSDPFHFHVGLTATVEAALPTFVEKALEVISRWMCRPVNEPKKELIMA